MRHARRNVQRIARLAALGGLLCGGLMVSYAAADEGGDGPAAAGGTAHAAATGARLVAELGPSRTAGSWIGDDGRPVVAVTDEAAADAVERAGARPKSVRYTLRELRSATAELGDAPRVSGTAWAVDYAANQVVVRADSTVSAAEWTRLAEVADGIGATVRMERVEGAFTPRLNGAEPMFAGTGRCSAGFNVTDGRSEFVLTAGHCGPVGTDWFTGRDARQRLGETVSGSFPGDDYSLVRYAPGTDPGQAGVVAVGGGRGVRVTGTGAAAVGQRVFRSGSTTGLRSGEVTGVNATVNYPQGTVSGLIETTVCAEPGDSGGPLLAGGLALGVTSGGNGDCDEGGTTFFQPIGEALDALGVTLLVDEAPDGRAATPSARDDGAGAAPPADPPAAPTDPAAAPGAMGPADAPPAGAGAAPGAAAEPSLLRRVSDVRTLGPGLFVVAGSLLALVALRIRSERGRRRYRSEYARTWG
ncbi:protease [Streptomyces minutiscleroticus]|uniref:Protease n=1 Tax=Streptomyces minutiscleroticus TaxID=68238 RepID=A0A918NQX5_9ACTN|nr:S1 family peptidase [Streptomyces minutiscleroticus]GGX88219.1 protease [Streptomyces minutiscleroticus]